MKNLGYYNGEIGLIEDMKIPMDDRGCYFGDGVYDATLCRNYHIFALDEHVDRFFNSARLIDIEIPQTKEQVKELLKELVRKLDSGNSFVYFQVTRGTAPRNHPYPEVPANLWVMIRPKELGDIYEPQKLLTVEDNRYYICNIKTLNLIPNIMANQKAAAAGCHEAVFHRGERVTEGSHGNISILKDGVLRTAPTDELILPGITRKHVIEICQKLGIPVVEEPFTLEELKGADEILVTSSGRLCLASCELDGVPVGGRAAQLARSIQEAYLKKYLEETE